MPRTARPPADLGPSPPPGPLEGYPRPAKYVVGPSCAHGIQSTYSKGCRCPWCVEAWRLYRRERVNNYRRRKAYERDLARARKLVAEADAKERAGGDA
jgi:hypothetical protein